MLAPNLQIFEAMFAVPRPVEFTEPTDESRWPDQLQVNQADFSTALRVMGAPQREFLWRFFMAAIVNRLSIYFTNANVDHGLRIGRRDQNDAEAASVWYMPRFNTNPPRLDVLKSNPHWVTDATNTHPFFEGDTPNLMAFQKVEALANSVQL